MSELLLELFSEEIPATMQKGASEAYKKIFTKYFSSLKISVENIEVNVGARRVTIYVDGLPSIVPSSISEIKGPKISAPDQAVEGFCRSNNITKNDLEIKNINGADFYFSVTNTKEQNFADLLQESLNIPIAEYVWPKSMYWGDYKIKWVRPLKNILCIFDGEIVPFKYGHLTANNLCQGHRFMSSGVAEISSYTEYKQYLENNFVILTSETRASMIQDGLTKISEDLGLVIKDDPYLLEEVSGLVEYPRVLVGKIDQKFLSVPSEILVSAMKTHQKYFSVFDKEGKFAPYFVFVSNIESSEEQIVISGNEKVLSARLVDALYFYNQDLDTDLVEQRERLSRITFHSSLGSLYDKTQRLEKLCSFIALGNDDLQTSARLCKSDIVSEVVNEFPSLQGVMGYYYALAGSYNENVALAIRDHYKPQGANDECPKGNAALLALVDKMDSLCGLICAGEKPSGSKDPYALRRNALGIIRIILENKLTVDLKDLVSSSLELYEKFNEQDSKEGVDHYVVEILKFFEERVKYYFKSDYPVELISASLDLVNQFEKPDFDYNLLNFANKIRVLNGFINSEKGNGLIQSYKRINNLIGKECLAESIDENLFKSDYEKELFSNYNNSRVLIKDSLSKKDYVKSLESLASLHEPLSNFFENVLVKNENEAITHNRIVLLSAIRDLFCSIANFNRL